MIKTNTTINRPVNVVWNYFTNPDNWVKWHGGDLKEVIPGWQPGAKLIWKLGGSTTISELIPNEVLRTSGSWMDTTYTFTENGNNETTAEIITSDPKGGASFNDGGKAQKDKQDSSLLKLKESIESETNVEKNEVKNRKKGRAGRTALIGILLIVLMFITVTITGEVKPTTKLGRIIPNLFAGLAGWAAVILFIISIVQAIRNRKSI